MSEQIACEHCGETRDSLMSGIEYVERMGSREQAAIWRLDCICCEHPLEPREQTRYSHADLCKMYAAEIIRLRSCYPPGSFLAFGLWSIEVTSIGDSSL